MQIKILIFLQRIYLNKKKFNKIFAALRKKNNNFVHDFKNKF